MPCFKPTILTPLTGPLDVRSSPDLIPLGAMRWHQNFQTTERGRLCRRPGFERFLNGSSYNNQDLHDQLLNAQIYLDGSGTEQIRSAGREPITLLQPIDALSGSRTLFAASHSRIYELVESTGNWRLLGDGFGGPTSHQQYFHAASLGNTTIFTNNIDPPQSYVLGADISGSGLRRTREIADLATIGISAAKIVVQFLGVMLLMNVVADGARKAMRIHWSGYLQPLSWKPATESIAGYQDLDYDEEILAAAPLQGALLIYTNKAIWRMSVSNAVFSFKQVYVERRSRDKCLAYPRTLVSTGFTHYFLSRTGIYEWNGFLTEPERPAWLHLGSGAIFNDLDTSCCEAPVAEYRPQTKEILLSWPQPGHGCVNSRTFIFGPEFQSSDIVDQGFSAFANYTSDNQILLRDWLVKYCLCSISDLAATAGNFTKEGGDLISCASDSCSQAFAPTSLFSNNNPTTIGGRRIENTNQSPAADSLCALLAGTELSDWCAPCSTSPTFVAAASVDLCLKQFSPSVFHREICLNPTAENPTPSSRNNPYCSTTGLYDSVGYYSLLRGLFPFGKNDNEKIINNALIETDPEEQATPCLLQLKLGTSYRAVDPNEGLPSDYGITQITSFPSGKSCPIWQTPYTKPYESPDSVTMEEMRANNWDQAEAFQWPVFEKGRFIHFEIAITNPDGSPALGGAGCLSALHLWTQVETGC